MASRTRIARLGALLCVALLGACTSVSCEQLGGTRMLQYHLFFGRSNVSDQDWTDFAVQVLTANLPDGFTAFDGDGQWLNPATQRISKERVKVVVVGIADTPEAAAAIARVKSDYRRRFRQISVGTTISSVCAEF